MKKGASTASVTLTRTSDGTIQFTESTGYVRRVSSSDRFVKKLFDAINALV